MSQLIDTTSSFPVRINLVRAGVTETHVAAALDNYFATMAEHRQLVEAADITKIDEIPADADANEIAQRIVAARTRDELPPRARHELLTTLNEHHADWEAAACKHRDQVRTKLGKVLAQVAGLLDDFEVHAGTAQGLADHAQLQWRPYPEQAVVHVARTAIDELAAKFREIDEAEQARAEITPARDEIRIG